MLTHNLQKCPALFADLSESRQVERPDLDRDTAHSLAHFLETGLYHTLEVPGLSKAEKDFLEYERSVLVYQAADILQLPDLGALAEEKIMEYDRRVSIFNAMDVAQEVYEKLQNPTWYRRYLGGKIDEAFAFNEDLFFNNRFLRYIGKKEIFKEHF